MTRLTPRQIGEIGELVACLALSRPVRSRFRRALFRANRLGGVYPVVDLIVDVLDSNEKAIGFFYVQVKATVQPLVRCGQRLPVDIQREKYVLLTGLPIPAYLIGVNASSEAAFVVAADRTDGSAPRSLTTQYPLASDSIRADLFREVVSFWSGAKSKLKTSRFRDA